MTDSRNRPTKTTQVAATRPAVCWPLATWVVVVIRAFIRRRRRGDSVRKEAQRWIFYGREIRLGCQNRAFLGRCIIAARNLLSVRLVTALKIRTLYEVRISTLTCPDHPSLARLSLYLAVRSIPADITYFPYRVMYISSLLSAPTAPGNVVKLVYAADVDADRQQISLFDEKVSGITHEGGSPRTKSAY